MNTVKNVATSRARTFDNPIFYTVSAVLIQLAFLVCYLYFLSSYSKFVGISFTIVNILVLLFLISKDDNPSYKLIWIVVILGVPMIGGILYVLFGNKRASRRLGMRISEEHKQYLEAMQPNDEIDGIIAIAFLILYATGKTESLVWLGVAGCFCMLLANTTDLFPFWLNGIAKKLANISKQNQPPLH